MGTLHVRALKTRANQLNANISSKTVCIVSCNFVRSNEINVTMQFSIKHQQNFY